MDVFQSALALIRSAWTLAQSVSTLLIITHDCCDSLPTPRQPELCLRTISYREMEGNSREGKKELRKEAERRRIGREGAAVKNECKSESERVMVRKRW